MKIYSFDWFLVLLQLQSSLFPNDPEKQGLTVSKALNLIKVLYESWDKQCRSFLQLVENSRSENVTLDCFALSFGSKLKKVTAENDSLLRRIVITPPKALPYSLYSLGEEGKTLATNLLQDLSKECCEVLNQELKQRTR